MTASTTPATPSRLSLWITAVAATHSALTCSAFSTPNYVQIKPTTTTFLNTRKLITTPLHNNRRTIRFREQQQLNAQPTEEITATSTSTNGNDDNDGDAVRKQLEDLLREGKLAAAVRLLKSHPQLDVVRWNSLNGENNGNKKNSAKRLWDSIFQGIERRTAEADDVVEQVNTRRMAEFPLISQPRKEMTDMYQTLQELGHLQLFGAVNARMPPAAGSKAVRPSILEQITNLPMKALTPQNSNTAVLLAGGAMALLEGAVSVAFGININFLVLSTLAVVVVDRLVWNGALVESVFRVFSPGIDAKIQRHEAGHFLCAYLLGCPVEGCVLNAWEALQDNRFGGPARQVTAGTSFFDPVLSEQINAAPLRQVTRSSIDRYSIIVMAGIAAEAMTYQQADGGASDEMALIAFLSQLNGDPGKSSMPSWNNLTIRNQARWGALQAVLMLRHYKPCYEALVEALDQRGDLGQCIYAIENAARKHNLKPLQEPLGYIVELPGDEEKWTTEKPASLEAPQIAATAAPTNAAKASEPMDVEDAMATLGAFKKSLEDKVKSIDEKLDGINKTNG